MNAMFLTGQVVFTPRHLRALLLSWRENQQRWDAVYVQDNGRLGEPVILDPRHCIIALQQPTNGSK